MSSTSSSSSNGHGGSRPDAGRKPKALTFADTAALIAAAKNGDLGAARYLTDRILGRVATVEKPPVLDTAAPYEEGDWEHEERRRAFERQVAAEDLNDKMETRPAERAQAQNLNRLLSNLSM